MIFKSRASGYSLKFRVIGFATLSLAVLLGLLGWVIDSAYRYSLLTGQEERLKTHIYTLLAASDEDGVGLVMPEYLPDTRFNQLGLGLLAGVSTVSNQAFWRSQSMLSVTLPQLPEVAMGEKVFSDAVFEDQWYRVLAYKIALTTFSGIERDYTFWVAESNQADNQQLQRFRRQLFSGFAVLSVLFLLGQFFLLHWSLRPLSFLSRAIDQVEKGEVTEVVGSFPTELVPVVRNLNDLILTLGRQRDKLKNTLGDLAHSLKTPLAVVRNTVHLDSQLDESDKKEIIAEQVSRMDDIIQYQLKTLSRSSHALWIKGEPVAPVVYRIVSALQKVYQDKSIAFDCQMDEQSLFFGDPDDLFELLGNLLENAFKYGNSQVFCHVTGGHARQQAPFLSIQIEDDGPGIPEEARKEVLQRGTRMDTQKSGQGIGLSIANELVKSYSGELTLDRADLGGLIVMVAFF